MRAFGMRFAASAAVVLVAGWLAACSENNTVYPDVQATLEVFFDPNPAPITDYGEYRTVMCVGNNSGVGAYIHGAVRQPYSAAGEPYVPETNDENWYKRHFQLNASEGAYLPGGEGRCVNYTELDKTMDAYVDWTFFGEDELGNAVSGTGRLYLGAMHQN